MSKIIIYTFLMMGAAFVIGFAVAYLIKIISMSLNFFEEFSFFEKVAVRKRYRRIRKIRRNSIKRYWAKLQLKSSNELLDYYSPPHKTEDTNSSENPNENDLIRYYYGNY